MEFKNKKDFYEAPSIMIIEVKSEGLVCQSPQEALKNTVWQDIIDE